LTHSDAERLADVLDAAAEIEAIVARGRGAFEADPVLRRALERLLEIIGEAANGLSDEFRVSVPGVPWRDISRLRIVIAHHYHRVDPAQVWEIAANDCPILVAEIRSAGF
jgi:uncharacterized protein with HEPN domain